jgi:hypothetical protein
VCGWGGQKKDLKQIFIWMSCEAYVSSFGDFLILKRRFPVGSRYTSVKLNFHVYTEIGFSDLHQGKLVRGVVSLICSEISLFCRLCGSNFKLHKLLLWHALCIVVCWGSGDLCYNERLID